MNVPPSELAVLVSRCHAGIETLFRGRGSRQELAAGLADLLRELDPAAGLTACLLRGSDVGFLAARSATGPVDAAQNTLLRSRLASIDPLALGVQSLSSSASGSRPLAAAILESGRYRGALLIQLGGDEASEAIDRTVALLSVCAPLVALRLALETLQGEQKELAAFALVGQAFLGLTHELNNALNSMMLQTSVVQLRADPQTRQDLDPVRQHGAQAAGLFCSLQHTVQERRERFYAVDLNGVVAEVLEEEPRLRQALTAQLAMETPMIQGTRVAVKQFVRLLLHGVCAGTKSALRLGTEKRSDGAALRVEIAESPAGMASEGVPPVDAVLWQNLDEVDRQAGRSLLRQLGGEIVVEPREGRLLLRVVWG